jgi:hypothetical protein
MLLNVHTESLGPALILSYDLNGKGIWDLVNGMLEVEVRFPYSSSQGIAKV